MCAAVRSRSFAGFGDRHFGAASAFCCSVKEDLMRKSLLAVVGLTAMMLATPSFAAKETQADLQKEAKISMKKARSIALKKVPNGKIASSELERENGKLIYSFDIKTGKGGVTEVNVDAINGKVVDVHEESAAKEAAEKKQEAKEKKPPK
ncbi:MAG: hypothetical protein DMF58_07065 [Acidobacteria bacterium]|nr:MAG: hypothetical protein DMF58_07065 [Acidobacteriota bacterium]